VLAINPFATSTYPAPILVGQSLTTARTTASAAGFNLVVKGEASSRVTAYLGVLKQEPPPGTKIAKGASIDVIVSSGEPLVHVVTVVGSTPTAAIASLTHLGFTLSTTGVPPGYSTTVPAGRVLGVFSGNAANPTTASYGSALVLQLSKGPPPLPVPDVIGAGGVEALATLQQSGFKTRHVYAYSRTVHAGDVVATTPTTGTPLQPGRVVLVTISRGTPTTVPSLGGADLANAEKILVDHGLTVIAAHGSPNSHNWTTTPPAGAEVPVGTGVTLYGH
jgi:eukaryotic-like serine/threonine-protein kinase